MLQSSHRVAIDGSLVYLLLLLSRHQQHCHLFARPETLPPITGCEYQVIAFIGSSRLRFTGQETAPGCCSMLPICGCLLHHVRAILCHAGTRISGRCISRGGSRFLSFMGVAILLDAIERLLECCHFLSSSIPGSTFRRNRRGTQESPRSIKKCHPRTLLWIRRQGYTSSVVPPTI